MCLPQTLLMPAKREFYILQSCCCSNCYFDPVPDGCLDGPDPVWKSTSARPRWRGRVTFDFHTGDVEVCCFQEDFACLAAPADAPRVCGVLGYTLYPAKGCCITLKQLYPERPEIVLKQNNTVFCAGCVGVGEKDAVVPSDLLPAAGDVPLRRAAVLLPRARFWIKHRRGRRRLRIAQLQRVFVWKSDFRRPRQRPGECGCWGSCACQGRGAASR